MPNRSSWRRRFYWTLLLLGFAVLLAVEVHHAEVLAPPNYVSSSGPFPVKVARDLTLHDTKRNKDLPFNVVYPDAAGLFPVIVFSHGAGGSKENYIHLTTYWAAHGYVVIQPSHHDSIALQRAEGEASAGMRESLHEALADPQAWQERPRDVSFVLDSLPQIERLVPELRGKMNMSRIGVGGHSFGAYTAEAIAGALVQLSKDARPVSFADKRVQAVIAMSPEGPGQIGFFDDSWKDEYLPIMTMTGSRDYAGLRKGPEWRKIPFERSPAGDKYHVLIDGANHFTFVGFNASDAAATDSRDTRRRRIGSPEDQAARFEYVKAASLAFWDAYLKRDRKALSYLQSDALTASSNGQVTLDRR